MNSIFGELTVADILNRISNIINQTSYISAACEALSAMGNGDSGEPVASTAEALAEVVRSRETTNQQILRLYEKIYDDLLRSSSPSMPEKTTSNE